MGVAGGPDLIQDGLVLALDASDRNSYVSGSTTWFDLSGLNNSGSLTNGPTFNTGSLGSIVFDGVDDLVIIPKNSVFFGNSWTWQFWVYYLADTGTSGYNGLVWAEGAVNTSTGDNGYQWLLTFRNLASNSCYSHLRINNVTTGWAQTDTNAIGYPLLNRWTHVVWSFNNGNTKLYIDTNLILDDNSRGVYGAGIGSSVDNTNSRVFIGGRNDIWGMSNMRVSQTQNYNRALSASEILQNYNATKTRFGL